MDRADSESGVALMSVMLLMAVVGALCCGIALSGTIDVEAARNHVEAGHAAAAARAGMSHALALVVPVVREWEANGFASASEAISSLIGHPGNGSLEAFGIPTPPSRLFLPGRPGASYEARLFDDDDRALRGTLSPVELIRIGENGLATVDANTRLVIQAIGHTGTATAIAAAVVVLRADGSVEWWRVGS